VAKFEYLGKTLTVQYLIREEIKGRLNSRERFPQFNPESLIFSSAVKKDKFISTIILPVVLYGCEIWRLALKDECGHKVEVEVKLRQSVGQSVLVSGAHLGRATNFTFSLTFSLDRCGFIIFSALSDDRTGV
jgi:hypothetical protein